MSCYQRKDSWCGPAAIQNALRVFGHRIGQERIATLTSCGEDGSDENDLLFALAVLGCDVFEVKTNRRADAREQLLDWSNKCPVILSVDNWGHWVTVTRGVQGRLWLIDSAKDPWNMAENGSWSSKVSSVLRRWKAARRLRSEGHLYYGIAVFKTPPHAGKKG